ncbi:MAG: putative bifunctional diguanylate cyclase/phosphodiesterase [Gammaproteobacteria bacterium]
MNTSGLNRRQDARNTTEIGIPRSLAWFGFVATAVTFLIASALMVVLEHRDGQQATRAALERDAAVAGRHYALARASMTLALTGWSHELLLKRSARSLDKAFNTLALSNGDALLLTGPEGDVLGSRGPDGFLVLDSAGKSPRFVFAEGIVYVSESVPLNGGRTLHAAFDLTARSDAWQLGVSPILKIQAGPVAPSDTQIGVALDQDAEQSLVLILQPARALLHDPRTLMLFAAAALVLLCTLVWVWRRILGAVMSRYWHRQLTPMTHAIERIRQGNCTEHMLTSRDHPLYSITRDFNAMQDEIEERQSKVDYQSQFDALTGLMTRAVANERIARAVDRATFSNQRLAAVAIDVSRFNEINGTLGQEAGDLVLKELAQRLSANTRVSDTVARVGGDEFMLLLEDVDDKTAEQLVEFLVSTLEAPIVVRGTTLKLKIRGGLALFPDHGDGPKALRRMANIALMTAKESQRKVMMYEPGQDEKQLRELAIIHDLPGALRDGELYLQYQPKIDVESQRVETVEALVRWRHPQLGFIPPDEFIGLLEKAGQISQLTDWVFKAAIEQVRDWNAAGYDLGVAVNISANDLRDETLPQRIQDLLHHYVVKPARLSIEVTESAVIEDPERAVAILQEFRTGGLKIALDDFGTGQTSLSLLKQLPLSQVKIDKSFVQHLRADSGDAIIVKSIIDLGHNMGLLVTAEGVESNYCWNLLKSYQCDLVQGYLVSAPLTSDELCQWYLRLQKRHVNKLDYSFLQNAG